MRAGATIVPLRSDTAQAPATRRDAPREQLKRSSQTYLKFAGHSSGASLLVG